VKLGRIWPGVPDINLLQDQKNKRTIEEEEGKKKVTLTRSAFSWEEEELRSKTTKALETKPPRIH